MFKLLMDSKFQGEACVVTIKVHVGDNYFIITGLEIYFYNCFRLNITLYFYYYYFCLNQIQLLLIISYQLPIFSSIFFIFLFTPTANKRLRENTLISVSSLGKIGKILGKFPKSRKLHFFPFLLHLKFFVYPSDNQFI